MTSDSGMPMSYRMWNMKDAPAGMDLRVLPELNINPDTGLPTLTVYTSLIIIRTALWGCLQAPVVLTNSSWLAWARSVDVIVSHAWTFGRALIRLYSTARPAHS